LKKLSSKSGRKILLREKTKFLLFEGIWADENFLICFFVPGIYKELERIRIRVKLIFKEFGPLFSLFCTKSPKIWLQLCPATLLFIRPFLSYGQTISQLATLSCWKWYGLESKLGWEFARA
jgi:hypothetical protein